MYTVHLGQFCNGNGHCVGKGECKCYHGTFHMKTNTWVEETEFLFDPWLRANTKSYASVLTSRFHWHLVRCRRGSVTRRLLWNTCWNLMRTTHSDRLSNIQTRAHTSFSCGDVSMRCPNGSLDRNISLRSSWSCWQWLRSTLSGLHVNVASRSIASITLCSAKVVSPAPGSIFVTSCMVASNIICELMLYNYFKTHFVFLGSINGMGGHFDDNQSSTTYKHVSARGKVLLHV